MPSVTIHVATSEVEDLNFLFEIQRDFFPGQSLIQPGPLGYDMELDEARAKYLLDMLRGIPDLRGFEPFQEWQRHQLDQMPLEFGMRRPLEDAFPKVA